MSWDDTSQAEALRRIAKARRSDSITLDLAGLDLTALPSELWDLDSLVWLYLQDNQLEELPAELGRLKYLYDLDLSSNNLVKLPAELGRLQSLIRLNLQDNQLQELPAELGRLKYLHYLFLSRNNLTKLPAELGQLQGLYWLYLQNNQLEELPTELGQLTKLCVLNLSHNNLTRLPAELAQLETLRSLNLEHNQLENLPAELAQFARPCVFKAGHNNKKSTRLPAKFEQLQAPLGLNPEQKQLKESPQLGTQAKDQSSLSSTDKSHQIKPINPKKLVSNHDKLARKISDKIEKSSKSEINFLEEFVEEAKQLCRKISESIVKLVKNPDLFIAGISVHLKSCAVDFVVNTILGNDLFLQYLYRLSTEGLDYQKAQKQVDNLIKINPYASQDKLCDSLIHHKFMAATGVEIYDMQKQKIHESLQYQFLDVSSLLEEMIYQIGYCYGFDEFKFYEDIVVFAIVYSTERLKRLGIDLSHPKTEFGEFCINGFVNWVSFQAIGHAAKLYYKAKKRGVSIQDSIQEYKKIDRSVKALVDQQFIQKKKVDSTIFRTVNATAKVVSNKSQLKKQESNKNQRKNDQASKSYFTLKPQSEYHKSTPSSRLSQSQTVESPSITRPSNPFPQQSKDKLPEKLDTSQAQPSYKSEVPSSQEDKQDFQGSIHKTIDATAKVASSEPQPKKQKPKKHQRKNDQSSKSSVASKPQSEYHKSTPSRGFSNSKQVQHSSQKTSSNSSPQQSQDKLPEKVDTAQAQSTYKPQVPSSQKDKPGSKDTIDETFNAIKNIASYQPQSESPKSNVDQPKSDQTFKTSVTSELKSEDPKSSSFGESDDGGKSPSSIDQGNLAVTDISETPKPSYVSQLSPLKEKEEKSTQENQKNYKQDSEDSYKSDGNNSETGEWCDAILGITSLIVILILIVTASAIGIWFLKCLVSYSLSALSWVWSHITGWSFTGFI